MTVGEALREGTARLSAAGVENPGLDALLLLSDVLRLDKAVLLAHPEREVSPGSAGSYFAWIGRRCAREPLQYIRGVQEFWGLPIRVGPGCLIPRPETEHLVEIALDKLKEVRDPRVAEIGVGSGCVLAALSMERPDGVYVGVDVSLEALAWASLNLAGRPGVLLVRSDLADSSPLSNLDMILSNPPYVTPGEWPDLPPEVAGHEPEKALLCASDDAIEPYRALCAWGAEALRPGGNLVVELGAVQASIAGRLRAIHESLEWEGMDRDLAQRLRVASWRKKPGPAG